MKSRTGAMPPRTLRWTSGNPVWGARASTDTSRPGRRDSPVPRSRLATLRPITCMSAPSRAVDGSRRPRSVRQETRQTSNGPKPAPPWALNVLLFDSGDRHLTARSVRSRLADGSPRGELAVDRLADDLMAAWREMDGIESDRSAAQV